ncbi:MAG TPA: cytochrome P450, partial [Acidimicrobiales bacterium]|nr:cytochrome P450 [Acidimicrobiales bacterium]
DYLVMLYASGNRDEAVYGPTAGELDLTRAPATPNLAFGFGEHFCLGAALARQEAKVLFEEMGRRRTTLTLAGEPTYLPSSLVRGPSVVPMSFG